VTSKNNGPQRDLIAAKLRVGKKRFTLPHLTSTTSPALQGKLAQTPYRNPEEGITNLQGEGTKEEKNCAVHSRGGLSGDTKVKKSQPGDKQGGGKDALYRDRSQINKNQGWVTELEKKESLAQGWVRKMRAYLGALRWKRKPVSSDPTCWVDCIGVRRGELRWGCAEVSGALGRVRGYERTESTMLTSTPQQPEPIHRPTNPPNLVACKRAS